MTRIGVVTFPGSLDDRDAARAVRLAGGEPVRLWHGDADLHGVDAVVLPGGFSYGDYLRCGAIARFAPVMESIAEAARDGLPVLGICNGFQILCEAHLLPGALTRNQHLHFRNRDQRLRIESTATAWTNALQRGQEILIPVKNGEGCYVADARTLDELEANGRVVARYVERQPQRLAARHRGDPQRGRQRRRHHAAPRARGRGAHRPVARRARLLHLGAQAPGTASAAGVQFRADAQLMTTRADDGRTRRRSATPADGGADPSHRAAARPSRCARASRHRTRSGRPKC